MHFSRATLITISLYLASSAVATPLLQKRCSDAAVVNSVGKPAHDAAVQAYNTCVAATGSSGDTSTTSTTGGTSGGTDYSSPSYWSQWWHPASSSSSGGSTGGSTGSTGGYGEECGALDGNHWQPWTWHAGCEQYVPQQDGISCCGTPCGTYPGGCKDKGS